MSQEEILKMPLFNLTVEQFLEMLSKNQTSNITETESAPVKKERNFVYGIRGLANLLNCSISTANRIKKRGVIDDAIIQQGRTIMVDVDKALKLLKEDSE